MARIRDRLITLLRSGPGTRWLLILFAVLVLGVIFAGLQDTPGYILGYLATAVIFLVMVRGWRSVWSFIALMLASFAVAVFLAFLYVEVISRIAIFFWGAGAPDSTPMRIIEAVIANLMLFAGPVGLVYGFIGALLLGVWRLLRLRARERFAHDT